MEAVALLFILAVLFAAAGIAFWAMRRYVSLDRRLHPLTPEQRERKRKAYRVIVPLLVVGCVLGVLIGAGGTGAMVGVAILAALLLLDAVLTPLLHYRRSRRRRAERQPPSA